MGLKLTSRAAPGLADRMLHTTNHRYKMARLRQVRSLSRSTMECSMPSRLLLALTRDSNL